MITEEQVHVELAKCKSSVQDEIKSWLDAHEKAEFAKHDAIDKSLQNITSELQMIGEYIKQGKWTVVVIKWVAYITATVWAIAIWSKDHLKI